VTVLLEPACIKNNDDDAEAVSGRRRAAREQVDEGKTRGPLLQPPPRVLE
jgi:hypothetical protein